MTITSWELRFVKPRLVYIVGRERRAKSLLGKKNLSKNEDFEKLIIYRLSLNQK